MTFLEKMRKNTKTECRFVETILENTIYPHTRTKRKMTNQTNFSWDSTTTSAAAPNGKTQASGPKAKSAARFLFLLVVVVVVVK